MAEMLTSHALTTPRQRDGETARTIWIDESHATAATSIAMLAGTLHTPRRPQACLDLPTGQSRLF